MLKRSLFFCAVLYLINVLVQLKNIEYAPLDERAFSHTMEELQNSINRIESTLDDIKYYIN